MDFKQVLWMVDPTEGYNRKKIKLVRNPHGSKHTVVSKMSQALPENDKESKDYFEDSLEDAATAAASENVQILRKRDRFSRNVCHFLLHCFQYWMIFYQIEGQV